MSSPANLRFPGFLALLLAVFTAALAPAWGQTIVNPSFENPSLGVGAYTNSIPSWPVTGGNAFIERISGFASDGVNHLGMDSGVYVIQDQASPFQSNSLYILEVAVGNRSGWTSTADASYYGFAGTGAYKTANAFSLAPVGTFVDAPPLYFSTAAPGVVTIPGVVSDPSRVGGNLSIFLTSQSAGRSHFDNVRLRRFDLSQPITVQNANSSGSGSLREAIFIAWPGATINFASALSGQTIPLGGTELLIDKNLTINGFGLAKGITISGGNASRVFNIASGSTVTLDSLTITGGNGGGVVVGGIPGGGGLQNSGSLNLARVSVVGNSAAANGSGGGILNHAGGSLAVTNSTIANNSATLGGGIYAFGTLTLTHATITNNSASGTSTSGAGGGLRVISGSASISNSILAQNTAPASTSPDIAKHTTGTITATGANLIGDNASASAAFPAGPLVGTAGSLKSPQLAPLGDYGGPTKTMPPLQGSPALDAAAASAVTTDQRGISRPQGGARDIGAVESNFALQVTNNSGSGPGSLRDTIDTAIPGSTITFAAGLNGQTILLGGTQLLISKNLTIDGSSLLPTGITISGGGASRVFDIAAGTTVTLDSLTITGGSAYRGAGVNNFGTLNINRCTVTGNTASDGGGIANGEYLVPGVTLNVTNCTVANNSANSYGGGIYSRGTATITHSTITGNSSGYAAGGMYLDNSALTITNTIFAQNTAVQAYPDLWNAGGGVLTPSGVNFIGNPAGSGLSAGSTLLTGDPKLAPLDYYGGPTKTRPPLSGSSVLNTAGASAATTDQRGLPRQIGTARDIGAAEASITGISPVQGTDRASKRPTFTWAGAAGGSFTLFLGTSPGSLASQGVRTSGYVQPTDLIPGTTYHWRVDTALGGRIYPGEVFNFTVRLGLEVTTKNDENDGIDVNFISLREAIAGSDIGETITFDDPLNGQTIVLGATGQLVITKSLNIDASALPNGLTISGNNVSGVFLVQSGKTVTMTALGITGGTGPGAGIRNNGTLTVNRCSLFGNNAPGNWGGGIFNEAGVLTVNNCTIANNSAQNGGGIFNQATATLNHTTITDNSAGAGGGGFWHQGVTTTLTNTIITRNSAPSAPDVGNGAFLTRNGVNFIGTGLTASATLLTGDAKLALLGDYGGPTKTCPPLTSSPVADAGAATALTTDQRGWPRVMDSAPDLGAVEVSSVLMVTNNNDAGAGSLRGALSIATATDTSVRFAPALSGQTITLTSGELPVNLMPVRPGTWKVSPWTGDADSGITSSLTYSHAYNLGSTSSPVINGVPFTGVPGGNPSAGNFTLAGPTGVLNNDLNNITAGTGSRTLATDFVFGGSPATLTLTGLTPGQGYRTSIFSVGWEAAGARVVTFSAGGTSRSLDQDTYGDNNGIRIDYEFIASGTSQMITVAPTTAATFHFYAFTNAVLPGILTRTLAIDASTLSAGLSISGNGASRVVNIAGGSTATLDSLTITAGSNPNGAGILNSGTLSVRRCTVSGNHAPGGQGGGIKNLGALTLTNSTVANNDASVGGGVYSGPPSTAITLAHTTIAYNSATVSAGGLYARALNDLSMTNTIIARNTAPLAPDGWSEENSTAFPISGGNFIGDLSGPYSNFGNPLTGDPKFGPLGSYGGPTQTVPLLPGSPAIDAATVFTSELQDQRGRRRTDDGDGNGTQIRDLGAYEVGTTLVTTAANTGPGSLRSIMSIDTGHEWVRFDPAVFNGSPAATITVNSPLISSLRALHINASSLAHGVTISGNNATRVFDFNNYGTLDGLTITAGNGGADGGGALRVLNSGEVFVSRCTFFGNSAGSGAGGAILNQGTLSVTNATFFGNTAAASVGGAISNRAAATLMSSTLSGNSAGKGGGIHQATGGSLAITNTLVAVNTGGSHPDIDLAGGTVTATGVNLIGVNEGLEAVFGAPSLTGTTAAPLDPVLRELGDYGGPTATMPLLPGSPAIDSGAPAAGTPSTDQRGRLRVDDGDGDNVTRIDIGAFEVGISTVTTGADSGSGSLRSIVEGPDTGHEWIRFDRSVFNSNPGRIIPVGNPSFETPAQAEGAFTNDISPWAVQAPRAPTDAFIERIPGFAAAGLNHLGMESGVSVRQTLSGVVWEPATIYSLEVAVGNRPGWTVPATFPDGSTYGLFSSAGGAVRIVNPFSLAAPGSFVEAPAMVINTVNVPSWVGTPITISLGVRGSGRGHFDNVRLRTVPGVLTITLATPLMVNNRILHLDSSWGSGGVTLSGNGTTRVMSVDALSKVDLNNMTIANGRTTAGQGGAGIESAGELTVRHSTFTKNTASGSGGAIRSTGTLSLSDSKVTDNAADGAGGGIWSDGAMTVDVSTIAGNAAGTGGGGIFKNGGTLSVAASTLSGNSAAAAGGGLWAAGSLTLTNATIAGNAAGTDGGGFCKSGGTATLESSTLSANSAGGEGGGAWSDAELNLTNTLIAGNRAVDGNDLQGGVTATSKGNLIGDGTGMTGLPGAANDRNQAGTGSLPILPLLAPLGDYGGPTQTMPLLAGSPAIDAGTATSTSLTTDQRGSGFVRVLDGKTPGGGGTAVADVGALEAGVVTLVTNSNDSGGGSLRAALAAATSQGARILFNRSYTNNSITLPLTSSELLVSGGRTIFLDASTLVDATGTVTTEDDPLRIGAKIVPRGVTVSGNNARRVFNIQAGSNVAFQRMTITNGVDPEGGCLLNSGVLTMVDSTIANGVANGGRGGAIYSDGATSAVNLRRCTLNGSRALEGGAIFATGALTIENCTLSGNTGTAAGGAIQCFRNPVVIRNSTIAGNSADNGGGGIWNQFGTLSLESSIIANNTAGNGPDIYNQGASLVYVGTNLVQAVASDAASTVTGPAPLTANPVLGTLADNGGPTQTMAFPGDSPAINAGVVTAATPFTDQRGFARVLGGGLDLGAVESGSAHFSATGLDLFASGVPEAIGFADGSPLGIGDTGSLRFEISTDRDFISAVTTAAGTGATGALNGAGLTATFSFPSDVARDSAGNVFIADTGNNRIRMIAPDGTISTVAGTGSFALINGNGAQAAFAAPAGVAVGPDDNVYVSDTLNHIIRKLTRPGAPGLPWTVSTVAGFGVAGFLDGTGTFTMFDHPHGLALDAALNIYVADTYNHRIRRITPERVVSSYAGTGTAGLVDGPRAAAKFASPFGVAVDRTGNIFVADHENHCIRQIGLDNLVSTVAGRSALQGTGNDAVRVPVAGLADGFGVLAEFRNPSGITIDAQNNLLVADQGNHVIRRVARPIAPTDPWRITTIAGTGVAGMIDGRATRNGAQFRSPTGLCLDANGDIMVADQNNHRLRRVTLPLSLDATFTGQDAYGLNFSADLVSASLRLIPRMPYYFRWVAADGSFQMLGQSFGIIPVPTVVTTPATGVTRDAASINGKVNSYSTATESFFEYSTDPDLLGPLMVGTHKDSQPAAMGTAVDSVGNIYAADRASNRILKIPPFGDITTFAGTGTAGFADGPGAEALFDHPCDVAVDSDGNLYVADEFNHRIRKITPAGVVSTLAGSGVAGFANAATATAGKLLFPCGIAVTADGTSVYVADRGNQRIRVVSGGALSTLAGSGTAGFADGAGTTARFRNPTGVAVDELGNVFVADRDNHRIRVVNADGWVLTAAGAGTAGFLDGPGLTARFASPSGVTVDDTGNVYVADRDNHRLRRIDLDSAVTTIAGSSIAGVVDSPGSGSLYPATAAQFSRPVRVAAQPGSSNVFLTEEGSPLIRKVFRGDLLTISRPTINSPTETPVTALIPKTLLSGATYYYRICASNSQNALDPALGAILSFTTPAEPGITVSMGNSRNAAVADGGVVDFGTTPIGVPVTRQFTIINSGGWPLIVSGITVPGSYTRTGGIGTVAPGDTLTFSVTLTAASAGVFAGDILIASDDPEHSNFSFPITGQVFDPPAVTTLAADNFGAGSATLNAAVNPADSATTVWFEYSPDPLFDGVLVSTVAGASAGFANGTGPAARFDQPNGVAADTAGNLYVADTLNHRIRKITPAGVVTTLAGNGGAGFADGPALSAQFNEPMGVAVGANGTVFVTDSKNHRIRAISPDGVVSTFSGIGAGFTDGVAGGARFNVPKGLAIDAGGNLYVADSLNHRIRQVAPDGSVSTFAGTGTAGFADGAGSAAQFSSPSAIAVGADGILYVTETTSHAIRKILADGTVSTFAGSRTTASFLDASGTSARFSSPTGLVVDANGTLYVADKGNHRIRRIAPNGTVTTRAGSNQGTADGLGSDAQFDSPVSLALIAPGTVAVGESGHSTIRHFASTGAFVQAATGLIGTTFLPVSLPATNLSAGMWYFRAIATNAGGRTVGAPLTLVMEPEITIEQPAETALPDGGTQDFGSLTVGVNASLTFTVRNTGSASLTGLAVTIDGSHASDFSVTASAVAPVVAQTGSTTFTVRFAPSAAGARTATLHVASNDADETSYDIILTGVGLDPFVLWQQAMFGANAGNPLFSDPLANPTHDGVDNLTKYALGLDPNVPFTGTLPAGVLSGNTLTLTYTKALAATNVDYIVEWSTDLVNWTATGVTEQIISTTPTTQQTVASIPASPASRQFVRLRFVLRQP